jgi:heme/copper-type cytochrome/quinol oxidase subunit 2
MGDRPSVGVAKRLEALMNGNGMMMMVPVVVIVLAALVYLGVRRHRRGSGETGQQRSGGHQ